MYIHTYIIYTYIHNLCIYIYDDLVNQTVADVCPVFPPRPTSLRGAAAPCWAATPRAGLVALFFLFLGVLLRIQVSEYQGICTYMY